MWKNKKKLFDQVIKEGLRVTKNMNPVYPSDDDKKVLKKMLQEGKPDDASEYVLQHSQNLDSEDVCMFLLDLDDEDRYTTQLDIICNDEGGQVGATMKICKGLNQKQKDLWVGTVRFM